MSKITLDSELKTKLNGMTEPVEICDESGQPLGRFVPEDEYRRLIYAAVESACPHDAAELKRRRSETGGQSLAQFWESLKTK